MPDATHDHLLELSRNIWASERERANSEFLVQQLRAQILKLEGELEILTARLSWGAIQEGVIDGKNAEERKLQLQLFLSENAQLKEKRTALEEARERLASEELGLALEKARLRNLQREFDVSMAAFTPNVGRSIIITNG